ncbi:MATE family efflux transporter [Streptococcus moroccensis]|uniref:Probable multidrug resistance protein NorM n=1 Tax=Streptococcus moroccensis TaxID=1451356 RepID=A0ABT9YSB7_9STRE|nr:MATE family efflux transporter [Streptococcus moroccensis]MDQ0222882.1 putative MATE family efflux protein [Streptococcus moroccensis]
MTYQRELKAIALPVLVENTLQALMTLADTYLVSQLGLVVISGVALSGNILAIYQALFIAVGAVVSAAIAKSFAQKKENERLHLSQMAIQLTIWLSVILGGLSLGFGESLLALLGAGRAVSQAGGQYLAIVGGASLSLGLMVCLGAMLRAQGQTKWPMVVSFTVNALNILLSGLAVFVFRWGVVGVATGTVIARFVGVGLLWHRLSYRPKRLNFQIDKQLLQQVFPAAGERLMMRAGDLVVVALIVQLGTTVVAGHAIGETLIQFNYLPAMSVAVATVILSAQAHGQQDDQLLEEIRKASYWLAFRLVALVSGTVLLFSPWLIRLYTHDAQAILAAQQVVWMAFIGFPLATGTLILTALWQGVGRARIPFVATTVGMWALRVGLGFLLTIVLGLGLSGVLIATIADNAFRVFYLGYRYQKLFRRAILAKKS